MLLVREGIQYHWFNRGYKSFEDFLESLTYRKRKNIRKERKQAKDFGGMFVKLEYAETDYDDISVTTANNTKITADIDNQVTSLSVGRSF